MLIRTNSPTSRTLMLSLTAFLFGSIAWFTLPEFAPYAIGAMIVGYFLLLSGTLFKGV